MLFPYAFCSLLILFQALALAQSDHESILTDPQEEEGKKQLTLIEAVMCERVRDLKPIDHAVVFSVSLREVSCFSAFQGVTEEPTVIYHRWYHRDELSTQIKLRLFPPEWSTHSSIQLRDTDKGPWRVEIADQNGGLFKVLRFSITD
jgi:hypothetical protein